MRVRLKLVRALLGAASAEELKGLDGANGVGAASGSRTGLQGRAATRRTGHGFGQPRVAQPEQGAPEAHVEEDIRIDEGGPHPKKRPTLRRRCRLRRRCNRENTLGHVSERAAVHALGRIGLFDAVGLFGAALLPLGDALLPVFLLLNLLL